MRNFLTLVLLFVCILPPALRADRRKYAWTYQYAVTPPGEAELEFYQTTRLDDADAWEYRIELEHGLSSRSDLAVYQIFAQADQRPLVWDAVQLRFRYRLADPGHFPLNPVAYLEYQRRTDLREQNRLETKLILGRDFSRLNISINPVYELAWAPGDPVHEYGADLGISYEPSFSWSLGLETLYRRESSLNAKTEQTAYIGPALSYAAGSIYYTLGYVRGLTDESDDGRVRFLLGVEL